MSGELPLSTCNPSCQCFRKSKPPFPAKKPEPFSVEIFDLPMTISEAQVFQDRHDRAFHPDIMTAPKSLQIEHSTLHIAKVAGHLADLAEKSQHGETTAGTDVLSVRVADLLIFALKLANLFNVDLERLYKTRVYEVEVRQKL